LKIITHRCDVRESSTASEQESFGKNQGLPSEILETTWSAYCIAESIEKIERSVTSNLYMKGKWLCRQLLKITAPCGSQSFNSAIPNVNSWSSSQMQHYTQDFEVPTWITWKFYVVWLTMTADSSGIASGSSASPNAIILRAVVQFHRSKPDIGKFIKTLEAS